MVLVDTSVWVRYFLNRLAYSDELDRLLEGEMVVGHELVFGELLIGSIGGRERFLAYYQQMPSLARVPHDEVVLLARSRHLTGRGIGWIDAHLLASALVARVKFWTADIRLAEAAGELGVAYTIPKTS